MHDRFVRKQGDATLLVQGSTGGGGLRGVQTERTIYLDARGAVYLRLDRQTG